MSNYTTYQNNLEFMSTISILKEIEYINAMIDKGEKSEDWQAMKSMCISVIGVQQ